MQIAPDMLASMKAAGWTESALIAAGYEIVDYPQFYADNYVDASFTVNGVPPSVPVPEVTGQNITQPVPLTAGGASGTGTPVGFWGDLWDWTQSYVAPFSFLDPFLPGGLYEPGGDADSPNTGGSPFLNPFEGLLDPNEPWVLNPLNNPTVMIMILMMLQGKGLKNKLLPLLLLLPALTKSTPQFAPSQNTGGFV